MGMGSKMEDKDLVRVIRCKNCSCFISIEEIKQAEYSESFINVGELIKADGYCDNINLWVKECDYCSQAEPKE